MSNSTHMPVNGWVSTSPDRGSIDILWASCITVFLCCWVCVYPNCGSMTDKWYHPFIDKFSLACISLLGPDFLFGIAFGQFSSARRCLKLFRQDPRFKGLKWTYTHAFFINMGGIHLTSPDFPQGFPIDAQQLHYLVSHDHVDLPDLEAMDITERNSVDTLSRLITFFQAFWFCVSEIQRCRQGLPMTTLELTAISFSLVMFATSVTWYFKPSITRPRSIPTKNGKTVQSIRYFMQEHTHPMLPVCWYQTPLEAITHGSFGIDAHWRYYTRLSQILHIPIFSRPITSRPWDRFPSDLWFCPDFTYAPIALCILLGFSGFFLIAWNFYFPSYVERLLWRICSVYHAVFSVYGGIYFLAEMFQSRRRSTRSHHDIRSLEAGSVDHKTEQSGGKNHRFLGMFDKWRNISASQDPAMSVRLRILGPVSVMCFLYVLSRGYIYIEDFVSLRKQPAGVYVGVNKFIPFLGGS